ncbi:MAG: hypothetical protein EPN56_11175 [Rhodanobacter sp.]|nr:MAG: hypothetical protein EPN66_06365 [Rhodanobacter sp.]TAM35154.1 MAG: hypothetical protein EPN56_11175 [Rhodanobacter sp.]
MLLPSMASGFPIGAVWLGQLLAAAWLGVAVLNWLQRRATLGGIYGRPIVPANLALYFVSALSLMRVLRGDAAQPWIRPAFLVSAVLAVSYGALLLRGPFNK